MVGRYETAEKVVIARDDMLKKILAAFGFDEADRDHYRNYPKNNRVRAGVRNLKLLSEQTSN